MYKKTDTDLELEKLVKTQNMDLYKTFQENYSKQQRTLDLFEKSLKHCDFNKFTDSKTIWNLASFINIVSFDLKIVGEKLIFADIEWEKRYFARQAVLIIYESLNDIFDLSGKEFRNIISKFSKSEDLKSKIKSLTQSLNEYKDEYYENLKEIRNSCIAHREQNCIDQLKK